MHPRLLSFYNRELQHVRDMGSEFAREFPKIAGRLGLDGFECADPYVERLLEGFAFLAARVHLKLDAEFPTFTQHLLEIVYPHFLAPTPSMAVVQLRPEPGLVDADGHTLPRGTVLRSAGSTGETPCEYRTAHGVTLWPVRLVEAEYYAYSRDLATLDVPTAHGAKAAIRLRLRATDGLTFDKLAMDRLQLYLRGSDALPMHVYEQLLANAVGMVVRPARQPAPWHETLGPEHIGRMGFDDEQALLPHGARSFQGYRLLQEYFAFPQRFMFVELSGLGAALRRCADGCIDVVVLLDRAESRLENVVDASCFELFCTPAINLFEKRADRIHLADRASEYHVVVDRTRPMDFEIHGITSVVGHGTGAEVETEFRPFYAVRDSDSRNGVAAYYAVHRKPRLLSSGQRRQGPRTQYVGTEVFLSLVDAHEAPYDPDLRQLSVAALCTNRDLPLLMPVGRGRTDMTLQSGGPVAAVVCIDGPTEPRPSTAVGETAWRLINHLSLNYLSLVDGGSGDGAGALRELLSLYGDAADPAIGKQIEGVKSIATAPCTRRIATQGPIAFGRGVEVTLTFDESAFEGTGAFLLGAVMERFFAKYVSINSFTETVVKTTERGEIKRWPVQTGLRHAL